jgi:hypothetical protein
LLLFIIQAVRPEILILQDGTTGLSWRGFFVMPATDGSERLIGVKAFFVLSS